MTAYYNEIDPYAADWLRRLIDAGHVPAGDVDTRSITELQGRDLDGYTQVHLFAGIGGWPLALRLAGWADDRPCWTGSCPCQPFSSAGKQRGHADERHLWPEMFRLVRECRPPIIFGEQVASSEVVGRAGGKPPKQAGTVWLDGILADLDAAQYTVGAVDLPAAGVGAPHIRQRLYWVGFAQGQRDGQAPDGRSDCPGAAPWWQRGAGGSSSLDHVAIAAALGSELREPRAPYLRAALGLANAEHTQSRSGDAGEQGLPRLRRDRPAIDGDAGRLGDAEQPRPQGHRGNGDDGYEPGRLGADAAGPVAHAGAWADATVILCRDGKHRRISVEPGVSPLAHGIPARVGLLLARLDGMGRGAIKAARRNRVGRLRGYGNAISPVLAAEFVLAVMEVTP